MKRDPRTQPASRGVPSRRADAQSPGLKPPPSLGAEAWARFEELAARRDAEGRALVVPVLGTGFNAQAHKRLDWRDLLVRVARDLSLSLEVPEGDAIVGNTTLVWEAMLTEIARKSRRKPR